MFDPAPADALSLHDVKRVLVIKLRHHGDVLLAAPVLSALKAAVPQASVDALVYADTAPMLSEHPALDRLHTVDRSWKNEGVIRQAGHEWSLLRALRDRRYDLLIHLTDHPRGAWLARSLRPRWSVAPEKPGAGKHWKRSFTHLYPGAIPGRHTVEVHLDALRRLGIRPPVEARAIVLVPGAEAVERIDKLRRDQGWRDRPFVVLHPASRWFFKCWSIESNAALLKALAQRGHHVVLTAAPDARETSMVQAIVDRAGVAVTNLSGALSLKELAALIGSADFFVGVDSAPMHIAAAMGTPCVALFGPSSEKEWRPWSAASAVVASDEHACRPCRRDGCGGGKVSECLTSLPVSRVLDAIDRLRVESTRVRPA